MTNQEIMKELNEARTAYVEAHKKMHALTEKLVEAGVIEEFVGFYPEDKVTEDVFDVFVRMAENAGVPSEEIDWTAAY